MVQPSVLRLHLTVFSLRQLVGAPLSIGRFLVALCVLKRSSPLFLSITVGWLCGLGIGAIDGFLAALQVQTSLLELLSAVALVAGLDALVGALFGLVVGLLVPLRRWGLAMQPGRVAFVLGGLVAAMPAAALAAAAVLGTSSRVNRLLAGGVVSAATLAGWLLAFWLAPAASRLLTRGPASPSGSTERRPGTALVPLVVTVAAVIQVWLISTTDAPLRRLALIERASWAGVLALCVPLLCAVVARGRGRWAPWTGAGAFLSVSTVLLVWGGRHYESDLQFLPWHDLLLLLAVGMVAGAAALLVADRPGRFVTSAMLMALSLGVVPLAAESEAARKVATASAGLAGTVLTQVRLLGDWDRDGHPRFFGGGDCDDRNSKINPAALDWPLDG
ncbi:MAG: hypothetical protein RJA70_4950, partial [Pseudomonadota bacterium]